MKKILLVIGLAALPLVPVAISGCTTTQDGEHGLKKLEEMSEADYQRLKLYSTLGVKIAANRLVQEGVVSAEDLTKAVAVLNGIATTPVLSGPTQFLSDLLANSGLTDTEVTALVQIVVFELQARGVLDVLNPDGTVALSPRTKDFVDSLVEAVGSAAVVTTEESENARSLGVAE